MWLRVNDSAKIKGAVKWEFHRYYFTSLLCNVSLLSSSTLRFKCTLTFDPKLELLFMLILEYFFGKRFSFGTKNVIPLSLNSKKQFNFCLNTSAFSSRMSIVFLLERQDQFLMWSLGDQMSPTGQHVVAHRFLDKIGTHCQICSFPLLM